MLNQYAFFKVMIEFYLDKIKTKSLSATFNSSRVHSKAHQCIRHLVSVDLLASYVLFDVIKHEYSISNDRPSFLLNKCLTA